MQPTFCNTSGVCKAWINWDTISLPDILLVFLGDMFISESVKENTSLSDSDLVLLYGSIFDVGDSDELVRYRF